jgi:protein TonB
VPLSVAAPPPLFIAPVEKPRPTPLPPAAAPAAPPARPTVITNPDWSSRPSGEDIARYYPDRAQRLEISGRAELSCSVLATGKLSGCAISSEEPADQGFGDAAIKLSKLFKMRPQTKDGAPVSGGTVRIPLRFVLAKE